MMTFGAFVGPSLQFAYDRIWQITSPIRPITLAYARRIVTFCLDEPGRSAHMKATAQSGDELSVDPSDNASYALVMPSMTQMKRRQATSQPDPTEESVGLCASCQLSAGGEKDQMKLR